MFNKNFYPTPDDTIKLMLDKIRKGNIRNILEPSAGKGNIIDYIHEHNYEYNYFAHKVNIDAIEIEEDLKTILYQKDCILVGNDFLTFETNKEYDLIIANPPFDEGAKHLLKMIEIAKNQKFTNCQILCLLNAETIKNPYSEERKFLRNQIEFFKGEIDFLENQFSNAERQTNVEVALVHINIIKNDNDKNFEFFDSMLNDMLASQHNLSSNSKNKLELIIPKNEIGYKEDEIITYINMYNKHIEKLRNLYTTQQELDNYLKYLNKKDIRFYYQSHENKDWNSTVIGVRSLYWDKILNTSKFRELLTNEAYDDLQKKINSLSDLEITLQNVSLMIQTLSQNQYSILNDTLVKLFEKYTSYHQSEYSKNIHYYNGWKTNDAYKMNKKIIFPSYLSYYWKWERSSYNDVDYSLKQKIEDILKVFKLISSKEAGEWKQIGDYEFENNLIHFKQFKKGTCHVWFKDLELLDKLNFLVGQQKNWLPTEDEIKNNKEAQDFIKKEFPNLNQKLLN